MIIIQTANAEVSINSTKRKSAVHAKIISTIACLKVLGRSNNGHTSGATLKFMAVTFRQILTALQYSDPDP